MAALQILNELTDTYLLIDTCHGDKICTTFAISSTTRNAVGVGQPSVRQPGLYTFKTNTTEVDVTVRICCKPFIACVFRDRHAAGTARG